MFFIKQKKYIISFLILLVFTIFSAINTNASTLNQEWSKQYGGTKYDELSSLIETSDGGFVAAGYTYGDVGSTTNIGSTDAWIIKVSKSGIVEWSKQFGTTSSDRFYSITEAADGGYLAVGNTSGSVGGNTNIGQADGYVLKVDSNGNEQWSNQYGSTLIDELYSVDETSNGDFVISGATFGTIPGNTHIGDYDGWILKISNTGAQQWSKQYGSAKMDFLRSIKATAGGGVIASGYTFGDVEGSTNPTDSDGWIIKVDDTGTIIWSKQFGSTSTDSLYSIEETTDGDIISAGTTQGSVGSDTNLGSNDGWIIKVSSSGVEKWSRQYGGTSTDFFQSIKNTSDNGYVAAGYSNGSVTAQPGFGQNDGWILKIDYDGNQQWTKQFGTSSSDAFYAITPTSDGGYVAAGYTDGNLSTGSNLGSRDGWILKLGQEFVLDFDLNGAQGDPINSQNVFFGLHATAPTEPTRDGYNFIGWNTTADGTGTTWDFNTTTMPESNVTLYAQWELIVPPVTSFTVSFNLNGASGSVPSNQLLSEGDKIVEPQVPSRTGYKFIGWSTSNNNQESIWNFNVDTMPANDLTLYALWIKNSEYVLTFNLNGGKHPNLNNQILSAGQKATKPTDPIKDGYTFIGWNTKKDGSGLSWNFNKDVMPANNVTLYAQWSKNKIPVTGYNNDVIVLSTILVLSAVTLVIIYRRKV